MTRRTITITAPNGGKVITVRSRRYFVVYYVTATSRYNRKTGRVEDLPPTPVASVERRTDSPAAALAKLRQLNSDTAAVFDAAITGAGTPVGFLDRVEVERLAAFEKSSKRAGYR